MTFPQLVQLYAPLAGLLVFSFFLGALYTRVANVESRQEKIERRNEELAGDEVERGRMLERLENQGRTLEKIQRDLQGMQRTLANIASGKVRVTSMIEDEGA